MTERSAALRRNLWKLNVLGVASNFGFSIPIVMLFQERMGLTLGQAFLLQALYSVVLVALEVPSGYLADLWGRRNALLCGAVCLAVGVGAYALGSTFGIFLLGEILLGIGGSLHSGTVEALTYDTLAELGEEKRYRRVIGAQGFWGLSGRAMASLLAGVLLAAMLRLPFYADFALFLVSIGLCLSLMEPHRARPAGPSHLRILWATCTHTLVRNPVLRNATILYTLLSTVDILLFWFLQPYQSAIGLPLAFFGATNALICLAGAWASRETHKLERWINDRTLLLISSLIIVGSCLALGWVSSTVGLALFVLAGMAYGFFDTVISDIVNREASSDTRATVLSLRSFSTRLFFAAASPFLGAAADASGVNGALLLTGIIGTAAIAGFFLAFRPQWTRLSAPAAAATHV